MRQSTTGIDLFSPSPHLVRDYCARFELTPEMRVLDPCCGTGTVLVECKKLGIPSLGIEAHPMSAFASAAKINWSPDPDGLLTHAKSVAAAAGAALGSEACSLRTLPVESMGLLIADSIGDLVLHKTLILLDCLERLRDDRYFDHERLALAWSVVHDCSNLHFGPEVGVEPLHRRKRDAPVLESWLAKIWLIAEDLRVVQSGADVPAPVLKTCRLANDMSLRILFAGNRSYGGECDEPSGCTAEEVVMMNLSPDDVALFYKLHPALLVYVNQELGVVPQASTAPDLMRLPPEERRKVRDALVERLDLIDSFVEQNPVGFSTDELAIVRSWKSFIEGRFYVVRYLTRYAVFLDDHTPPKAYGVLALADSFEDIIGPYLPILVGAVLLPFKGRIVYDGLLTYFRISFGSGARRSFGDSYQEAKAEFGIITSLPFSPEKVRTSDAEILKAYLKTERSRDLNWDKISKLINSDPALRVLYHQEMGKVHARTLGRQLRELGLADAWFAIVQGNIVAGAKTRSEVERIAKEILPPDKQQFAYFFYLKSA